MRFDDSLRTVLAADTASAFGAQSAFRQLVDLLGRGRVPAEGEPLERLRTLRDQVPAATRAASARALALAEPPAALVALFAEDEPAVAAPVLRSARLSDAEWLDLLPRIGPAGRALLRARTGLSGTVARGLEAFGATDFTLGHDTPAAIPASAPTAEPEPFVLEPIRRALPPVDPAPIGHTFAIADLVERIETFHRDQQHRPATAPRRADRFAFETDSRGAIEWVDGVSRAGLVGVVVTGIAARATTLSMAAGPLAGTWAVAAVPRYAPDSGRLTGYRGGARRLGTGASPLIEPEALRRLVHELRTPTNAIAGFAELIATGLLGPVSPVHRTRAETIGRDVQALIGAIDDLDISARVDGGALDLSPRPVDLGRVLTAVAAAAAPDGRVRVAADGEIAVVADDRALDRLLSRLTTMVAGAVAPGEQATVTARAGIAGVSVVWPWSAVSPDASLLGTDFALRLSGKLARAIGGTLVTEPGRLTLHLSPSLNAPVQATTH